MGQGHTYRQYTHTDIQRTIHNAACCRTAGQQHKAVIDTSMTKAEASKSCVYYTEVSVIPQKL